MSYIPDHSRVNQEILREREEELERNTERAVERDAGPGRSGSLARITGWVRSVLNGPKRR
jgi:hypothetical protein